MNFTDEISQRVTIVDALNYYAPRNMIKGRCPCPIHDGEHNNFKIYSDTNSFYCFTCQEAGNVIKLVSLLFNIPYRDAIKKIDADFNLCLFKKPTLTQYRKRQAENKRKLEEYEIKKKQKSYSNYAYYKLIAYKKWLKIQTNIETKTFQLNYIERLLDKYLNTKSLISFDVDTLILALETKFE